MEPKFIPIVEEFAAERKEEPGVTPLAVFRELLRSSRQAGFFQRIDPVSGGAETILGVEPFETIRFRGLEARLEKASGQVSFLKGDPFSIVGERLKANFAEPDPHRTPFAGAALGYFAYDCVRLLEPVLCATPGNLQAL